MRNNRRMTQNLFSIKGLSTELGVNRSQIVG